MPPGVSASLGKVALRIHPPLHAPIVDVAGKTSGARSAVDTALSDFDMSRAEHIVLAPFVALGAAIVGSIATSLGDSETPGELPQKLAPTIGEFE